MIFNLVKRIHFLNLLIKPLVLLSAGQYSKRKQVPSLFSI